MPKQIWEINASSWFYYKEICYDARSHECKMLGNSIKIHVPERQDRAYVSETLKLRFVG
jgi:hypothetical protein